MSRLKDVFYGCILGGAFGDALGYPVEFLDRREIESQYGPQGVCRLEPADGKALISDDTQMTLFTMAGIAAGMARMEYKGIGGKMTFYINMAYCDWLHTQEPDEEYRPFVVDLYRHPELHDRRAPGVTCLGELAEQLNGSENPPYTNFFADPEHPRNTGKGCGGVMRVAPVGLMVGGGARKFGPESAARLGAEAAAITHGHPLGWLSAALLAQIVYECRMREEKDTMDTVISRAMQAVAEEFAHVPQTQELFDLCQRAIELAHNEPASDADAIRSLGEGWVGEEALAVAIYACVRHREDFHAAVCASVNHDGDSDSTGAIAGNIIGAYLGYEKMNGQLRAADIDLMQIELAEEMKKLCDKAILCAFGQTGKG